jgi:dienelactone hydrolase
MRGRTIWVVGVLGCGVIGPAACAAEPPLADYFRVEVGKLAARPLAGIDSAEAWTARRPELQRQLAEMLGLWPMPAKAPLEAQVKGQVERPDFVVEKVLYQSLPGLYVTGNLYRPKAAPGRLPAILYVCGHSKVEKDGVIYGCKAHYQHHAAWYAAHGFVCLVVDTLQLGELPGLHHGMHNKGMWWWQSRGYTPAGVEAWNGIRGIDYLAARPEVDPAKIGVTGRSGGGATSWWIGALDDRVAAVVPVAGITDLTNHVVDGVVEGHCDCMYPVNTYRWDFPLVAALVAPRPLLVENTDHDPIFPEDGVRRVYRQLEKVYAWYGARDRLGLVIGKGGHVDSTEVRHPSFAFMTKWLKGENLDPSRIDEPDRKVAIEDLKVLQPGEVPRGNRNDTIHETLIAPAEVPRIPDSAAAWESLRGRWLDEVRIKVFGGWPDENQTVALQLQPVNEQLQAGVRLRTFNFTSQAGVRLRLWLLTAENVEPTAVVLTVSDPVGWPDDEKVVEGSGPGSALDPSGSFLERRGRELERGRAFAWVAPRGIGPSAWPVAKDTHIRRRFALLGQTLDAMRAWDVRRALAALRKVPDLAGASLTVFARRQAAPVALWAAVFESEVASIVLSEPPATVREGPALLNVERILGMPQALALLYPRAVNLIATRPESWRWASGLAAKLTPDRPWPEFDDSRRSSPRSGR